MPYDNQLLCQKLSSLKNIYHNSIQNRRHRDVIRSGAVINNMHEYVVEELVNNEVPRHLIYTGRRDATIEGFFKTKNQDILVKKMDNELILSVNVRSQLSSIRKNFDTIFERYIAESVNLHVKFPNLVCGYLILFPTYGYNDGEIKNGNIVRDEKLPWEKYLKCFDLIARRNLPEDPEYEYESLCLLVVDFSTEPPTPFLETSDFHSNDLVSRGFAEEFNYQNLNPQRFFDDLINKCKTRYGDNVFIHHNFW